MPHTVALYPLDVKLSSVSCIPYFMSAYFPCCSFWGLPAVQHLHIWVSCPENKGLPIAWAHFPCLRAQPDPVPHALHPVSEACNLILDPTYYSLAAHHPRCHKPRCLIVTRHAAPPHCCKSLVTVDRRWTAVCRLLKLSWHFLQRLLHIDKRPPRRHRGGQSAQRRGAPI